MSWASRKCASESSCWTTLRKMSVSLVTVEDTMERNSTLVLGDTDAFHMCTLWIESVSQYSGCVLCLSLSHHMATIIPVWNSYLLLCKLWITPWSPPHNIFTVRKHTSSAVSFSHIYIYLLNLKDLTFRLYIKHGNSYSVNGQIVNLPSSLCYEIGWKGFNL